VVSNDGSAMLERVTFSSNKPTGWVVTFEPSSVSQVSPDTPAQVTVNVKPAADAIPGDYSVKIYVSAEPRATTANIEFRVTVLGSTAWGFVGLLIILVVVAGLVFIFWRLGRR